MKNNRAASKTTADIMYGGSTQTLTWEMKDYLEKRREELKRSGESGFTLMEMLIVVAIIAILVAIAIPVFTSQLEKSRDAVSVANMRSAYAEAATEVLTTNTLAVTKNVEFKGQVSDNYSGLGAELPFTAPTEPAAGKHDVTFTWTANSDAAPTVTIK